MFEQHSALAVQGSLSMWHSVPPQTPPLQASVQQSRALLQATPSARQASRHFTMPVPDSGSQRPLQQLLLAALHSVPGASQLAAPPLPPDPDMPPTPAAPPA